MAPLVTVAQYEAFTGTDVPALDEPRYLMFLNAASTLIRNTCRWHIAGSVTEELTFSSRGGSVLVLPTMEVTALEEITLWPSKVYETVLDQTYIDTYISWSKSGLMAFVLNVNSPVAHPEFMVYGEWPYGYDNVRAKVTHGFASTPEDLVALICSMVDRAMAVGVGSSVPQGIKDMQTGSVRLSFDTTIALGTMKLTDADKSILVSSGYVLGGDI